MATKSRKRHAPITDTDSDESLTASQSQSKSSVPKKPYVPRFLIIHSEVEGRDISLLSPFAICVNCSMPEHCQPGQCERPAKCANF